MGLTTKEYDLLASILLRQIRRNEKGLAQLKRGEYFAEKKQQILARIERDRDLLRKLRTLSLDVG